MWGSEMSQSSSQARNNYNIEGINIEAINGMTLERLGDGKVDFELLHRSKFGELAEKV